MPDVQVTAINRDTGVQHTVRTNSSGFYTFPELPVGNYDVVITQSGFREFRQTGLVIHNNSALRVDAKLEVGETKQSITVSSSSVQVETISTQMGEVITGSSMTAMPLNGRAYTDLLALQPGVVPTNTGEYLDFSPSGELNPGNLSMSGQRESANGFMVNGGNVEEEGQMGTQVIPNLDSIAEFRILTNNFDAEYGNYMGGQVNVITKSGTNQFHGDAFEFYRDTFLNTANFYEHSVTTGKPTVSTFHQNIPGGTIGGPIWKDKLFFFGAYQLIKEVVPEGEGNTDIYSAPFLAGNFTADNGTAGTPPTATEAWGNFAADPIPSSINVTGCTAGETWAQCAYGLGGIFPTANFNSIATTLANKYLAPSLVPGCSTSADAPCDYIFNEIETLTQNQYIGRIDFNLNPNNKFLGVYIHQSETFPETIPFTGANVPGFPETNAEHHNLMTIDYVHQFSPTLVNDLAAHYTRFNYLAVEPSSPVAPSSAGFSINPEDTAGEGLPVMSISSPTGMDFTLGFSANGPQPRIDQVIQFDDSVSKVFGKHTLKFGYDGRRFNVSNPFAADNDGTYSFNPSSSTYSTGDGALDFLLGIPGSYEQGSGATIQADAFLNYIFGQDSWKLTPTFTLDYGLAYAIDTPLHNNQYEGEGIACLDPGVQSTVFPTAPLSVIYPGDKSCTNAGYATTRYSEFGPRLGFAWAPNLGSFTGAPGKFAIRGGFGIYYNRTEEESALQTLETPPFGLSSFGAEDFGGSPEFANPFVDINGLGSEPNKFPYAFPTKGAKIPYSTWANLEPLDLSTYSSNFRAPYAENFQLSVEREFPSQIVMRLSYVGSLSRHNQTTPEGDYETAAGQAACAAGSEYSPIVGGDLNCVSERNLQSYLFPQNTLADAFDNNTGTTGLVSIGEVSSESSSSYNAFQADITKGITHGLLFQISYTYSHALDDGSSFEDSGFGESGTRGYNQWVKSLNYGDSQYDARQRLVVAPLYVIPKFDGSNFSPLNLAVAGWEVSAITTLATGFPYDISYAGATSRSLYCTDDFNFYACPDVPEYVSPATFGNPRVRNGLGYSTYITNTATAFAAETIGTFGDLHRNPYHGPGINNTNMILAKNFMLSPEHHISFQMRIESDNVFNHTQFSNPTSSYTSGVFGQITGAAGSRASQLAAKLYF